MQPQPRPVLALIAAANLLSPSSPAQLALSGDTHAHDPSRLMKQGDTYYLYRTSRGIQMKYSANLKDWTDGGRVFPGAPPSWTTNAVPGFRGYFWAPDLIFIHGLYCLYYSVSTWGSQVSAIGLAITTNLASGTWTDRGPVIQSTKGDPYNCIDPCPLVDTNGTVWLSFGSYWNGIYLVQLDPVTGKRLTPEGAVTHLASNSSIEASFLWQHGGYYYLFVNFGTCCRGLNSTYNIRLGRSPTITGPYVDQSGSTMATGGGSMFLEGASPFVGPGQAGLFTDQGTNWFSYHYYDGRNKGTPTLGLTRLVWSADGWPRLTGD
jgi:arabinan endo-1,5-alpha-L-arabinosidase